MEHYAESKLLHSWAMQNPQILWQTEDRAYRKIDITFQMITVWNADRMCEMISEKWTQLGADVLLTLTVYSKGMQKKCWRMKNNRGMLEVALSA